MKFRWTFWPVVLTVILLAVVALTACQSSAGTQAAPQAPAQQGTPYPIPGVATEAPPGGIPYPELQDGAQITWDQAVTLIMSEQVTKIMQTHDLKVYLTLKDGRTIFTVQQTMDDILKVVEACGDPCKEIKVATE